MRLPALVIDPMGVLGGAEDHEHDELVLDVVEPVRHVGADEHDRAGGDRRAPRPPRVIVARAADHVVDLVLGVRALGIRRARRQDVQARPTGRASA